MVENDSKVIEQGLKEFSQIGKSYHKIKLKVNLHDLSSELYNLEELTS
jgi:hypothetical protein